MTATANAHAAGTPYDPLTRLRATHNELLKRHRQEGDTPQLLGEIEAFIRRERSSGQLLDAEADRWAAQGLLDYWVSTLYRARPESQPPDATLAEFDPEQAPELDAAACPYLGLDAFREEHREVFFGRQRLVEEMVGRLAEGRLLAVVGPSGSGKSSLVLAGLLPALKAGQVPGSESWHYYPPLVPGSNPLQNLARVFCPEGETLAAWLPNQVAAFRRDAGHLASLVRAAAAGPAVLVVDQFEEIFTLCQDDGVRQAFVDNLVALVQSADEQAGRQTVILTMRADFEPHLARLESFQPLFERAHLRVVPLNAAELRQAIEAPAASVGLKFEEGVVDSLLHDILGEPAALPLLQFTLLKLWEHRERNRVTREAYQALGGGRLALARSADDFYQNLIPEEQVTTRRILLRMVRPGDGLEFTSNRIRRESLYHLGEARDRIERVLDKLVQARLVRLTGGDAPGDVQVEVAHEALVRNWPRLVGWLEDEREVMRRRRRLTAAAEQWHAHDRDPGALLRGALLLEAQRYDDLSDLEAEFVRASQEVLEADRRREVDRQVELARAQARAEAERQRADELDRLTKQLAVALSNQLAAQAQIVQEEQPQLSLLLALEALNITLREGEPRVPAAEEALRQALAGFGGYHLGGHNAPLTGVAISADDRWLATASEDGTVQLWNLVAFDPTTTPVILRGHENWIHALAISPDGRWLATGGRDGLACLWDLSGPEPPANPIVLRGHEAAIWSLAISPDSHWLVTGGQDATARLWDLTAPEPAAPDPAAAPVVLRSHARGICALAVSPDGRWLVTAGEDNTARLWNLDDLAAAPIVLLGHEWYIHAVTFGPESRWLATGSDDWTVRLWDLTAPEPATTPIVLRGHGDWITSLAVSPDGRWLVTASGDKTARLWDLTAPNPAARSYVLCGHEWCVRSVAISPDSHWLVTASDDGTARLWNLADPDPAAAPIVLRGHKDWVTLAAISHDGHWLVTGSRDRTARLWDLTAPEPAAAPIVLRDAAQPAFISPGSRWLVTASGGEVARLWDLTLPDPTATPLALAGHQGPVRAVVIGPGDRRLATGGEDGTVRLWDLAAADPAAAPIVLHGHQAAVNALAISPDGRWLASGGRDAILRLWDLAEADPAAASARLAGHAGPIQALAIDPSGDLLATAGEDGTVRLWDLADPGAEPAVLRGHEAAVLALAIDPAGRWLASGGRDGATCLWNLAALDAAPQVLRGHDGWVTALAFDARGERLVSAGEDGLACLWHPADPAAGPAVLRGHAWGIRCLSLGPQGRWLVTGSDDWTARLWDLDDLKAAPVVLRGHRDAVWAVTISPDGRWLVTVGGDHTARLWNLRLDELIDFACRIVGRNLSLEEWQQYFPGQDYHKTCARLPVPPSVIRDLLEQAQAAARAGDGAAAEGAFRRAVQWAVETNDIDLNDALCRAGRAAGLGDLVEPACRRAPELAPVRG